MLSQEAVAAIEQLPPSVVCSLVDEEALPVKTDKKARLDGRSGDAEIKRAPAEHGYEVIARYPHDSGAFTEGLVLHNGRLFESTGQWRQSSLRELALKQGTVKRQIRLSDYEFGEGLTVLNGHLIQLTWKSGKAFVYRPDTLALIGQFDYEGEGWGATTVDGQLVLSNGSAQLQFLDPISFGVVRKLTVKQDRNVVSGLNELEFAEGAIFANVWPGDCIAEIDPQTGRILGWLNLTGLLPGREALSEDSVLNGMAYEAKTKTWLVTGKNWPYIYQIALQRNAFRKTWR